MLAVIVCIDGHGGILLIPVDMNITIETIEVGNGSKPHRKGHHFEFEMASGYLPFTI